MPAGEALSVSSKNVFRHRGYPLPSCRAGDEIGKKYAVGLDHRDGFILRFGSIQVKLPFRTVQMGGADADRSPIEAE